MNKYNFLETGGYPFETDTLEGMQNAYSLLNAIGYLAGDHTILSGCVVTGNAISDGVVFVAGEVLPFIGGTVQTSVRIIETTTTKEWENGTNNDWEYDRKVTFATGQGSILWAEFTRIESMRNLQSRVLPAGVNPQLYSGEVQAIPQGWVLCDGQNGVPDLRGQFIVGYNPDDIDYDAIGATGGLKEVTLTSGELPEHSHSGNIVIPPHTHDLPEPVYSSGGSGSNRLSNSNNISHEEVTQTDPNNQQSVNFNTSSAGGGSAHENRPPYYTLAYIIYTG